VKRNADDAPTAANGLIPLAAGVEELLARGSVDEAVRGAVALGYLAATAARPPGARKPRNASSFLMDRELVVQAAGGDSILRLPWFEDDLFVGRPVPDIREMPSHVRAACVRNYRAALDGERGRFAFTSYGHGYTVDAVPVRGDDDRVTAVLGVAVPHARRPLAPGAGAPAPAEGRPLTRRETEVLGLASEGLTSGQIAERLFVSIATVRTHFTNIYPKLGASDRTGAVAVALRLGLIN
jgi:DNA-binding CsgD family transcriptional regulator